MQKRDLRPFLYGGIASIAAEIGTFPIDTTKTRLQVAFDYCVRIFRQQIIANCFRFKVKRLTRYSFITLE